ncbi:MAG: DNA polymerase I [Methylovulum sp.]
MTNPASPRLILVDGSSFLFRAYHAVPPLSSPNGLPTNAIHGVTNMLRKLLSTYHSDYISVIFDAPGKTFRHELYSQYKAHRPPLANDLRVQIEPLQHIIRAMGLPLIMETGIEADDVLGVLAKLAAAQGFKVIISTGDKDMAQLVTEQIILENTMTDTRLDVQGVIDKFAVRPDQIIDYLALIGDTADNIPGVPKVGPKTAAKWLQEYNSIDNLIAHAGDIKGKIGENLRSNIQQLRLSQQLTTIHCDLPLPYGIDDLKQQSAKIDELKTLLTDLGFTAWLAQLNQAQVTTPITHATPTLQQTDYHTILNMSQFEEWLSRLEQAELIAIDTETTSLDYNKARIVGLSFAVEEGCAAYLPLSHCYPEMPEQLDRTLILEKLRPLLENPLKAKLGQNLKYDYHVLLNHGIHLSGITHDSMLASYVLNSTATKHNMDDLAKTYLGMTTISYEAVAGKGAKQISFDEVSIEQAAPYAAEDADITLRLHHALIAKLQHEPSLYQLYTTLEIPLISVLARIERNGVLIDSAMLAHQSQELSAQIIALEQHAYTLVGHVFNLSSPKQIQEIFYEQLNLPVLKKTPKGQPSTEESVLQELALAYPLPKIILEHRSLSKLKTTYTDKLPQQVDTHSGRIHTSYHQAVTATGRLSSTDPNLQNIPIRNTEGRKIRQAFIAPQGYKIIAADYSQIELRIMAHLSADERLLNAFNSGEDIHRATAADVFSVSLEQVTFELRRSAKAINFGLIYGMSAYGLAQQLGITRNQANDYIALYFARYPGVKMYMDEIKARAHEQGYVETLLGRRLYLPEIKSKNAARRQYAERTAINAPMQGTAADIIKQAMINVDHWLYEQSIDAKLIMQVHDELVFEVAENIIKEFSATITHLMCSAMVLDVPLVVDIGVGDNWDEAH